jgi:hypothetical protein
MKPHKSEIAYDLISARASRGAEGAVPGLSESDRHSTTGANPKINCFAAGGEMGALMRSFDWNSHPLGPVSVWPQSLCTAVSICLESRFPILIWWGAELFMLYNDAYRTILGNTKHPKAMGQAGAECWPEIWDVIGPMLDGVLQKGQATWSEDQLLLLDRNGYVEECYFTFSYSPIRDESGEVGGIFTAVTETHRKNSGRTALDRSTSLRRGGSRVHGSGRNLPLGCRDSRPVLPRYSVRTYLSPRCEWLERNSRRLPASRARIAAGAPPHKKG